MNYIHIIRMFILLAVLVTLCGCKSKQDKPGADTAVPQGNTAVPAVTSQDKAAAPAASQQDQTDARTAAQHVLAQFTAAEFTQIYRDSSTGFKQIGTEAQFVAKFQQTRQKTGVLSNPKEVSSTTRPGNNIVLIFSLENDRYKTEMRLTFARGQSGKMELAGLNQHDELKQ